jgi:hypothetical protein
VRDGDVEDSSWVTVIVLASDFIDANFNIWIFIIDQELLVIYHLSTNNDVWWVVLNHIGVFVGEPIFLNFFEFFAFFTLSLFISILLFLSK